MAGNRVAMGQHERLAPSKSLNTQLWPDLGRGTAIFAVWALILAEFRQKVQPVSVLGTPPICTPGKAWWRLEVTGWRTYFASPWKVLETLAIQPIRDLSCSTLAAVLAGNIYQASRCYSEQPMGAGLKTRYLPRDGGSRRWPLGSEGHSQLIERTPLGQRAQLMPSAQALAR
mgnify:CR=1 FL=1